MKENYNTPEMEENSGAQDLINEVKREAKEQQLKLKQENDKKNFEKGLVRLAEMVIEREHDPNDTIYILLRSFLDVALEMQSLMANITAINEAMSCMTDAISFIDSAINLDRLFIKEATKENYGFFARMKMKRQQNKAIKNNVNRMYALADTIYMKYDMANGMAQAMAQMGIKLKAKVKKATEKARKKALKTGTTSSIDTATANGDAFLDSIRAKKNSSGTAPSTKPSTGAKPTKPSNNGGEGWTEI